MNDPAAILERSLRHDASIRAAGNDPGPVAESRITDFIVKYKLYETETARQWLIDRSSTQNDWVAKGIIESIGPLAECGHPNEAVAIFTSVVGLEDEKEGPRRRRGLFQAHSSLGHQLKALLRTSGLVGAHPDAWSSCLVHLQSLLLLEEQQEQIEQWGETSESLEAIVAHYDDHCHYRYYQRKRSDRVTWGTVAQAIEQGLAEAVALPEKRSFCILTDHLIASKWGLAICQPLVALYDNIRTRTERSWQHSEAIRLLCLTEVEERRAAIAWRRLLRRQLLPMLSDRERNTLIMRIRESQHNDRVRLSELADFTEFAVLTHGEESEIVKARHYNEIFEPIDPRELRNITRTDRSSSETPSDQLIKTWPHAEDHDSLKLLFNAEAISERASISEVEASLFPRLDALNTIMKRPEIDSTDWMGEILRWCARAVGDIKQWYRIKHEIPQNGKIPADQYVDIYEDMVPWWENRVAATLKRLKHPPPEHHASDQYDHISWGSNDPIACSLMYLDEVLATPIGSRLDVYRSDLAETITAVWDTWPCYSHGLAITLLRPYHWATNKNLTKLLVQVLTTEIHSQNIELSLDHLLCLGQSGLSDLMRSLIARIETLTNPSEIAYRIGEVIGNAVARHRGDGETVTELADISYLYDDLSADRSQGQSVRYTLIASIIEGVRRHLGSLNRLDHAHSELWLSIVIWGLTEWLEMGNDKRDDMPVSPVNAVREMRWDNDQRTFLLEGMTDMLLRIIKEADIGAFYDMHYELRKLLEGDSRGHNIVLERATRRSLDQTLIALCRASAERVAKWHKEGRTTNDIAYVSSLTGDSTSELITLVFATAIDRDNTRRQLAPIIDILADAGLRDTSSRLRRQLRHS